MNFFHRLLGKRFAASRHAKSLIEHRQKMNQAALIVAQHSGLNLADATRRERSILATFFFGILNAHAMENNLTPPDVHALALLVCMDIFKFDDRGAVRLIDECINATKPGYHETMHAIIHRGIDAQAQLVAGDQKNFQLNLRGILAHFQNLKEE
jgi:hypothetical protein